VVDLGLVGEPALDKPPAILLDLLILCYVPVLACLGCTDEGTVLNINADTLAAALARSCGAGRLIVAGSTAGVLDADGSTIAELDVPQLDAMIQDGRASAGMVAKLRACRQAVLAGIDVSVVDGRGAGGLASAPGTRLARAAASFQG
jgi:acetylglutamate kinase